MINDFEEDEVEIKARDMKLLGKGLQKLPYLESFSVQEKLIWCVLD